MKTQTFDILDPRLNLYQKFFVEASAGCGKTFSIENAYLRLLLNLEKPRTPQEILVLTFTREATKELKTRIRRAIENAVYELENPDQAQLPYLKEILKQEDSIQKSSLRNLLDAQANFDQAQIFTLHSFCFRMLKENFFEAHLNIEETFEDEGPSLGRIEKVLKDFLNFKLERSLFCSSQIRILFQHYKGDFSLLLKSCIYELSKERAALQSISFEEGFKKCAEIIQELQSKYSLDIKKIQSDCLLNSVRYKGGYTREGGMYPELSLAIQHFVDLFSSPHSSKAFNLFLWDAKRFFDYYREENLKKRGSQVKLFYPELWKLLGKDFQPLIEKLITPSYILSHLISYVQNLYQTTLKRESAITPNNILESFKTLAQNKSVAEKIAKRFEAVIVDEFQDTDPIQWEILSSIFLKHRSKEHPFYLVGDPKQSIYAFRSADIYTYLRAAQSLGEESRMTLNTNYRSQPFLIEALNALFEEVNKNWIDLPRLKKTLAYEPVKSSSTVSPRNYHDDRQSIHFFLAQETKKTQSIPSKQMEEDKFFPFIVNEILRLHLQEGVPLNAFAILVRDRFQGARLKEFLKTHKLTFQSTRPEPLSGSDIATFFLELYLAVLSPKNISNIQSLKLNPFFNLFTELDEEQKLFKMMAHLARLKILLLEKGFLPFYIALMREPFENGQSLYEHILGLEEGLFFYLELEQIKDLLVEEEVAGQDIDGLKAFLEELANPSPLLEKTLPKRQNTDEEAIHILTLHMSKGLEFEIVFALGLINRTLQKEDLIPLEDEDQVLLVPNTYSKDHFVSHKQELNAEKLRQLYVALTRAKQRLYIPVVFAPLIEESKSSPFEVFMQRLGLDTDSLLSFIKEHPHMSFSELKKQVEVLYRFENKAVHLVEPTAKELLLPKRFSHSFTSLATKAPKKILEIMAPADFDPPVKSIHTLPAGKETGLLYHKIMESIDFQEKDLSLESFVANTPYESWREVLEDNVKKLVKMPLKTADGAFSLSDLSQNQIYREVEFLYPIQAPLQIEGCTRKGDFLHGFIDLVCCFESKYYLIDYKTNWLGPEEESYSDLNEAMQSNQYFLQAQIYKEALKNYLKLFEKRSFSKCFGGIYYLFIRGRGSFPIFTMQ